MNGSVSHSHSHVHTHTQDALRKVVRGVGGLEHAEFRAFRSERKVSESRGFVDGDLIETFLDLSPSDAEQVRILIDMYTI
jgi:DNA damage-binding protein 1